MKKVRTLVVVSVLLFHIKAPAEIKTGSISGKIFSAGSYDPLPGASVLVIGTSLGAATGSNGEFKIDKVPVGIYTLSVRLIGYETNAVNDVTVDGIRPVVIELVLREKAVDVGAITVFPDYFASSPDFEISTNVQSNEEVRRLPGSFEDVVRATSSLPGVAQAQPGRNDLMIRGGAPSENLFIIDYLEAYNINHFGTQGASGGPLSFINLDYVEQTAFSTGGFGVRYGDKLSSVFNIDLKKGRTDKMGTQVTLSATGFGADIEGPIADKGSYIFSARRSWLDLVFRAAGFSFVPQYWDFMAKLDYRLNRKNRLSAVSLGAIDDVKYFNDSNDDRYDNSRVLGSDQNQSISGVTWLRLLKRGYFNLTLGNNYVEYAYQQNDSLLQPIFKNISHERETYLKGELTYQMSKSFEITAGITGKNIKFDTELYLPPLETEFGDSVALEGNYFSYATKSSGFLQLSYGGSKFRTTLGGRLDYFDLLKNKMILAPRFSTTYQLNRRSSINFSLGRYYQAPAYIWLVGDPVNRELSFLGVDQHILGFNFLLKPDTKFGIEGYYKRYFDYAASQVRKYLIMANTGAGYGGAEDGFSSFGLEPLSSDGTGEAYGLELLLQKKLSEIPCYGLVSASLSESKFTPLDGITRLSSWDQRWIFNVGGGYIFNASWEIALRFRYASGMPYTPFNTDGTKDEANYNRQRLRANHSLDLRLDRRWLFANWMLITYVDIQNIYDRIPDNMPRWDERTGAIAEDESIGFLPSIGITVKF